MQLLESLIPRKISKPINGLIVFDVDRGDGQSVV
jgi:hypothetical protein